MRYKILLLFLIATATRLPLAVSETQNFAFLAQRQMQNDLSLADIQIKLITDRYQDLIDIIVYRQKKIRDLIVEVNQNLILKEVSDPAYKTCIEEFRPKLYSKGKAEQKFEECQEASEKKTQKLLLDVETPFKNARNIANIQWPMTVENCKISSDPEPTECVVAKAETYFWAFNDNMNDVQDNIEMNHGLSSVIARNAMECTFFAEKRILMKIGSVLQLIDVCLVDMDLPPLGEVLLSD